MAKDKEYLWKRWAHHEDGRYRRDNLDILELHPNKDEVWEYVFGDTAGLDLFPDLKKWYTMEELFENDLKNWYTMEELFKNDPNYNADQQHYRISFGEVQNAVYHMWIMGLVVRKEKK